jgi:carbamoyl-phosphate synthase large subunit
MKSVGEAMSIGRTFQESVQKALRSLETGRDGFNEILEGDEPEIRAANLRRELREAGAERILYLADAFREGMEFDGIRDLTGIDPWFLDQIEDIVRSEEVVRAGTLDSLDRDALFRLKRKGFSDSRIAELLGEAESSVRERRHALGIRPVYKRVDTCAAEFATSTAYMYSTYEEEWSPVNGTKSWCWAAARTGSGRASSLTIAVCTRRWRCARTAMKRSWSTATRRRCRRTSTRPTGFISSR